MDCNATSRRVYCGTRTAAERYGDHAGRTMRGPTAQATAGPLTRVTAQTRRCSWANRCGEKRTNEQRDRERDKRRTSGVDGPPSDSRCRPNDIPQKSDTTIGNEHSRATSTTQRHAQATREGGGDTNIKNDGETGRRCPAGGGAKRTYRQHTHDRRGKQRVQLHYTFTWERDTHNGRVRTYVEMHRQPRQARGGRR